MKLTLATACAVLSLSFAGAALADGPITATLAAPQAGHAKLIAAHMVWNCEGAACVTPSARDDAASVSACKDLAKQVGRLTAYAGQSQVARRRGPGQMQHRPPPPRPISGPPRGSGQRQRS